MRKDIFLLLLFCLGLAFLAGGIIWFFGSMLGEVVLYLLPVVMTIGVAKGITGHLQKKDHSNLFL